MYQKNNDDEFPILLIVSLIFTIFLIYVNIWYSDWHGMFNTSLIVGVLGVILNIGVIINWVIVLKEWQDPNFDKMRYLLFALIVDTILLIGGFRVAKNEWKMFQDDVDKAKQEQTK
jgi:hypothetical protein